MNHNITVSVTLIICMVLAHMGKRLRKANQGKSEMKKPRQTQKWEMEKKSKRDNTQKSVLDDSV